MPSPRKATPTPAADLSILEENLALDPPSASTEPPPSLPHSAASSEQPLLESYARFRSSPIDALREFGLHVAGEGWRSYNSIVGQQIFYNGFSERMKSMVMGSQLLQARISQLAEKRVKTEETEGKFENGHGPSSVDHESKRKRRRELEKQLNEVAELWTDQMICKMESRRFIRGAYYLCTQLVTRAYHQGMSFSQAETMRSRVVHVLKLYHRHPCIE